ncbi:MAG: peptide deformylase [Pseudomonadota bacterium]
MKRGLLRWPDRRLTEVAVAVEEVTDDTQRIWQDMIDTMEAMPGIGLAAPQIGIGLRLAIVDASTERGSAVRMANPVLIETEGPLVKGWEASPNLPGIEAQVTRHAIAVVSYIDAESRPMQDRFTGLWARSVQHQIDHLDGLLFIDRMSRTKRDMVLRKFRKLS